MMHSGKLPADIELSGNWCNEDAATSSLMEAVSFVTPVLENYFIRTVSAGLATLPHGELTSRCRAFIREESAHSRTHKKFNAALQSYLGNTPPGLALAGFLLRHTDRHLSLTNRLLLAAALEHFAAVISKGYIEQEAQFDFRTGVARELFAQHAREELAHRSVVFDLWQSRGTARVPVRILTVTAILLTGLLYVAIALPWILYRKRNRRLSGTLSALTGFALKRLTSLGSYSPLPELYSFVRRNYHPDRLLDA